MYFESLLTEKKWNRKMTFHFIVPVLILLLNYSRFFIADEHVAQLFKKLMFLIYIPFSLSYAVVTFYQLKSRMWIRKSDINLVEKQNLLLKKWSWVLISLFMLMAAKATLFIAFKGFDYNNNDNSDLLWSGAIHWIIIFLCFLANPDIIYGYNAISKKIENQIKHHVLMSDLWILQVDSSSITNIKDQKLAEKINFELQNHLIKIEEASFNGDFFRTAEANMDDFSTQIGIPTSHLSYIFKYHTSVSFTDFKKIVRIQDAIKLLKSDYLKTNTIEALAMEVGFSSYSPFFSSFKNITGLAPLEYIKTMQ
jgi:AraC-like DNA-binding protein